MTETKEEVFGANTVEKLDIAFLLIVVIVGSIVLTLSLTQVFHQPVFWWLVLPAAGLIACGVGGIYPRIEMIALRIRIEESKRMSALIDEIAAIYRKED